MAKKNKTCSHCNNLFKSYDDDNDICGKCRPLVAEEKFNSIISNNNGILLDKYVNTRTPVRIICGKCNEIFNIRPSYVNHGNWCNCSKYGNNCSICGNEKNRYRCDICEASRILIQLHNRFLYEQENYDVL